MKILESNTIPCVIFAFNRPEAFKRVLAAIRTQGIERLIIFIDGPRSEEEAILVSQCIDLAERVDWVEHEVYIGQKNRGLNGLSDNIQDVMSRFEKAVFLEDDCLPTSGFYEFMKKTLYHYEKERKIFSVGGYQPVRKEFFNGYRSSFVSSYRFSCWGWGTWSDRWENQSKWLTKFGDLLGEINKDVARQVPDLPKMAKHCIRKGKDSWAIKVAITALWMGKVHLSPVKGLIENIGTGTGSHGNISNVAQKRKIARQNSNVFQEGLDPIIWLDDVNSDKGYSRELRKFVRGIGDNFIMRIYNEIAVR